MTQKEESRYLHELPTEPLVGDLNKKIVKRALFVRREGGDMIRERRTELERIKLAYENSFSTEYQIGSTFAHSTLLANVIKKVFERLDFLNFDIHFIGKNIRRKGEPVEEAQRRKELYQILAKEAIKQTMFKAGFPAVMKESKDSAYWRAILYGDSFVVCTKEQGDYPIQYKLVSQENIYFPKTALSMRNSALGRDVKKCLIVAEYEFDEYMEYVVPMLSKKNQAKAKKVNWGKIPEGDDHKFEVAGTQQESLTDDIRMGEVGTYIDLEAMEVIKFAGRDCLIIEHYKGEAEFPFKKDNKPFIPVSHLIGLPSTKGFYNFGVGHYMFQKNSVDELIKNKTISGVLQEIDPIKYIQGRPGGRLEFQGLVYQAEKQVAEGHLGIVYDEPDENGQFATGRMETLSGKSANNIQEIVKGIIREDIIDFGISLREVQTDASKTATAIMSEQEMATVLIKEIAKRNVPEYRFLIETTIEYMKKMIKSTNKAKIDISKIKTENEIELEIIQGITIGQIMDFINDNNYIVEMDLNSGVIINPVVKLARLREQLQTSVNTPVFPKLLKEYLGILGSDYSLKDLTPPPQEGQGQDQVPAMDKELQNLTGQ